MGCSPLGSKDLDVTERLSTYTSTLYDTVHVLNSAPGAKGAKSKSARFQLLSQGLEDGAIQGDPWTCDRWSMQKQHMFYIFRIWAPFVMTFFIMYLPLVPKSVSTHNSREFLDICI